MQNKTDPRQSIKISIFNLKRAQRLKVCISQFQKNVDHVNSANTRTFFSVDLAKNCVTRRAVLEVVIGHFSRLQTCKLPFTSSQKLSNTRWYCAVRTYSEYTCHLPVLISKSVGSAFTQAPSKQTSCVPPNWFIWVIDSI